MSADADVSEQLLENLVRTSFAVIAVLTRTATEHELSLTQLRALAILRDREPSMAELAGYLGLERSSVSGLMDRAERRGLVTRTANSADGRSVRVSLTAEGRRVAARLSGQVADELAPMTDTLTASGRQRLTALLSTMLGPPPPVIR